MDLRATGTANRLNITWNGDKWFLDRVESNVWELWHLDDLAPTMVITNNNKRRVLALALHRIINSGGEIPA
jgi:hypothetical protein